MKSAVLARPNLKLFLLGAILLVVLQDLLTNGHSQALVLASTRANKAPGPSDQDLAPLLAQAAQNPSPELYRRISRGFEQKGDIKKALLYFRRAEKLAEIEQANE